MILAIIPAILWVGEHVLGPLTDLAKSGIEASLKSAGSILTGPLILECFEKILGPLEDTKKQELLNALASMTLQGQENIAEIQSPKKWYEFPHETLEMFGVTYLGVHLLLLTFIDVENFVRVHLGAVLLTLPPVDLTMFGMVMTLMGVYKIVGKFNVQEDE